MSAAPINTVAMQHAAILRRLEQAPATCAELEAMCNAQRMPARIRELVQKGHQICRHWTEQTDQAGRVRQVVRYSLRKATRGKA